MALRRILTEDDRQLRKNSREVTAFNERLHVLLDDMLETLHDADGVGLAAPQVGILRRAVIVLEFPAEEADAEIVYELINPEIIERDGSQYGVEGCLSIPGYCGYVERPMHVKVKALDRNGNPLIVEGEGLTARALCHEIDHLDGILYRDKADKMYTNEEYEKLESEKN